MSYPLSRRSLLAAGAAASALPLFADGAVADQPITGIRRLTAGTRTLEVNGRPAKVFRLTSEGGRQGMLLLPGEPFHVALANELDQPTIIHWHGQLPPWTQDGVPWPQTPPLAPGANRTYDYVPVPGTYWMHSHLGLQEQNLMAAPLIVRDAAAMREDRQEIILMLHDFSFRTPDELLAGLTGQTPDAVHAMVRQTENVPAPAMTGSNPQSTRGAVMGMASTRTKSMSMGDTDMDLDDITYDAFLANDRTLADPEILRVAHNARLRLRVINASAASQFWVDLGALVGRVAAVDGHAVHPVAGSRFPLAIAQRLDILVDLPGSGAFPILARLEGSHRQTGIVVATQKARIARISDRAAREAPAVDNSLETRLSAVRPLVQRKPDLRHRIVLSGQMKPYRWALNDAYWPHVEPLMLAKGQRVEIDLVNHSTMAHPMHLHGHTFQVVAVNGRRINGAVRDTVLVTPRMGSVRIAFDADNPGRWVFHCHNLYHLATGMMTEFRYQGIAV